MVALCSISLDVRILYYIILNEKRGGLCPCGLLTESKANIKEFFALLRCIHLDLIRC
jgi:hypothetical protein